MASQERIHRLRISLKRSRSLWRLAREAGRGTDPDRERSRLKEAKAALADTRSQEVLQKLLTDLLGPDPPLRLADRDGPTLSIASVRRAENLLKDSRRRLPAALSGQNAFGENTLGKNAGNPWRKALAEAYERARRRSPASRRAKDEAFHAWRKAIKDLLYALESRPWNGSKARKFIKRLDKLQDHLGSEHDLAELESHLDGEGNMRVTAPRTASRKLLRKARRKARRKAGEEKRAEKRKSLKRGRKLFRKRRAPAFLLG